MEGLKKNRMLLLELGNIKGRAETSGFGFASWVCIPEGHPFIDINGNYLGVIGNSD